MSNCNFPIISHVSVFCTLLYFLDISITHESLLFQLTKSLRGKSREGSEVGSPMKQHREEFDEIGAFFLFLEKKARNVQRRFWGNMQTDLLTTVNRYEERHEDVQPQQQRAAVQAAYQSERGRRQVSAGIQELGLDIPATRTLISPLTTPVVMSGRMQQPPTPGRTIQYTNEPPPQQLEGHHSRYAWEHPM